ncbi:MAG TPA: hypothetical protein VI172_16055 [Candidatus Dormibacteraeota bacterium]|jgi:hypothetical protein
MAIYQPTTWKPFDHSDPAAALEFLRNDSEQCNYRTDYKTQLDAAICCLQAMHDELLALRGTRKPPVDGLEYAVNDCSGKERVFKHPDEAAGFAVAVGMTHGDRVNLDVLCWNREAAVAYRGSENGGKEYDEDPEASVFERIEIRVNPIGRIA